MPPGYTVYASGGRTFLRRSNANDELFARLTVDADGVIQAGDAKSLRVSSSGARPATWSEPQGEVPKVHMGKQGKHIIGHPNYTPGRSILRADPNELAKRAGTGTPVNKVAKGQPGFKERVQYDDVIGDFVKDGVATPTRNAIITYAKDGSIHIIPAAP